MSRKLQRGPLCPASGLNASFVVAMLCSLHIHTFANCAAGHPECPDRVPAIENALRKYGLDGGEASSSDIDPLWVRTTLGVGGCGCAGEPQL